MFEAIQPYKKAMPFGTAFLYGGTNRRKLETLGAAQGLGESSARPLGGTQAAGQASYSDDPQRRLAAAQVAELVAEYQAGADMKELAKRWSGRRTTVAKHLGRAGVELRRQGLSAEQPSDTARLYADGWSLQRLAERYKYDAETVRQRLINIDGRIRRPWQRRS